MDVFRGFIHRKTSLPNSILYLQRILINKINFTENIVEDGRVQSSIHEQEILNLLEETLKKRIKIPKIRMWYDFLIFDFNLGWLPVNIKITTTKTYDNVSNLASLVHSYTDVNLDLNKHYKNGEMAKLLIEKLKTKNFNKSQKDYYFLVVNKNNNKVILNSIKGLISLKSNINNLPYQVKWADNKKFSYKSINSSINLFTELFKTSPLDWKTNFIKEIKELGQYFTKDESLKEKVKEFVKNIEGPILEPCIGRGDLVSLFEKRQVDMYEIDRSIEFLPIVDQTRIFFGDFLKLNVGKMYKTIVANPPYVKLKTGNIYKDFIEKCFFLLEENGEMVFIVASDFFKKTNCCKLLSTMMKHGCFTDIFYPKNENLFENASVDVVIFRYCKSIILEKICNFNNVKKFVNEINGIVTFENSIKNTPLSEFFYVKVGIVSGCEEVFKQEIGNKSLVTAENKTEKYILIQEFPSGDKNIDEHLLLNKSTLIKRKIRKFDENNWYQFGALRNINFIEENIGKKCIYLHNVSRKENVAFIGKVDFFSSNLLLLLPRSGVDLEKVNIYLNSIEFKENYTYSGRFMIGQKQVENHLIN